MFVNDMVKTYGYTRDRLNHFIFSIYNPATTEWVTIKHPTADEYVYLCDRLVIDWMVDLDEEDEINITVYMIPQDYEVFRKYITKEGGV